MKLESEKLISSSPQPRCVVCGGDGNPLFQGMTDRLFGATGQWSLRSCVSPSCGTAWLDPMPAKEDLWKAYTNYYTHATDDSAKSGWVHRLWRFVKQGYFADKFGYATSSNPGLQKAAGKLLYLFPVKRSVLNGEVRFLKARPGGTLLDVGCGAGQFLATMQKLGWKVAGVDFDPAAVKTARATGLDVYQGSVEELKLPSDSYDAVTLNHVIEHVPGPLEYLKECRRLLKPGGQLVVVTPNCASLGQRHFKADWRGWEPPRHLQIFATQGMRRILREAGFSNPSVQTHNALYVWHHSYRLKKFPQVGTAPELNSFASKLYPRFLTSLEQVRLCFQPDLGECIHALATK